MPSAFNVTTTTNDLQLGTSRQGSYVLTIANISGKPQKGRVSFAALDTTKPTWLSVADGADLTFPVGSAQQVTIKIAVPIDAAPGHYTFRPDVIAVMNPDEDSTQGPTLAFEVPPVPPPPPPPKIPWWIFAAAAAVVVLIVVGVLLFLFVFTTIVPNVVGQDVAAAQPTIVAAHLQPGTPTPQVDLTQPAGTVLNQNPAGSSRVGRGSTVSLVVAQNRMAPNLTGLPLDQAQTLMTSSGFTVGSITPQTTLTVVNNTVLDQNPKPGVLAAPGAPINLVVERNLEEPQVLGEFIGLAVQTIQGAGLVALPDPVSCSTSVFGQFPTVAVQSPPPRTRVPPNAPVTLICR